MDLHSNEAPQYQAEEGRVASKLLQPPREAGQWALASLWSQPKSTIVKRPTLNSSNPLNSSCPSVPRWCLCWLGTVETALSLATGPMKRSLPLPRDRSFTWTSSRSTRWDVWATWQRYYNYFHQTFIQSLTLIHVLVLNKCYWCFYEWSLYLLLMENCRSRRGTTNILTHWCNNSNLIECNQKVTTLILNFPFIWYGWVSILRWEQHVTEALSKEPNTAGLTSQADVKEARVSSGRDTGILHVNTGDGRAAASSRSQQLCALVAHWTPELRCV